MEFIDDNPDSPLHLKGTPLGRILTTYFWNPPMPADTQAPAFTMVGLLPIDPPPNQSDWFTYYRLLTTEEDILSNPNASVYDSIPQAFSKLLPKSQTPGCTTAFLSNQWGFRQPLFTSRDLDLERAGQLSGHPIYIENFNPYILNSYPLVAVAPLPVLCSTYRETVAGALAKHRSLPQLHFGSSSKKELQRDGRFTLSSKFEGPFPVISLKLNPKSTFSAESHAKLLASLATSRSKWLAAPLYFSKPFMLSGYAPLRDSLTVTHGDSGATINTGNIYMYHHLTDGKYNKPTKEQLTFVSCQNLQTLTRFASALVAKRPSPHHENHRGVLRTHLIYAKARNPQPVLDFLAQWAPYFFPIPPCPPHDRLIHIGKCGEIYSTFLRFRITMFSLARAMECRSYPRHDVSHLFEGNPHE